MQLLLFLSILLALSDARPQEAITSRGTPLQTNSQNITTRPDVEVRFVSRTTKTPTLRESVKMVANQLINNTAADFTLDTRTPPKIRLQHKLLEKRKQESLENSHPGVAVPVDVDSFLQETSTTKRSIFYRNDYKQPTTDSGISTWILLSGQSTTAKPTRKQTAKTTPENTTDGKIVTTTKSTIKVKPVTTQKPRVATTTTAKPSTETSSTTVSTTTSKLDKAQNNKILTKIKASILNSASKNKTTSTTAQIESTTMQLLTSTKSKDTKTSTAVSNTESNELPLEAKIVDLDLPEDKAGTTTKRPRRPTQPNKRKKNTNNKNRRRKPGSNGANEKTNTPSNSTKIANKNNKPFGTQIYNYLSREVMPTVGVGLVGLMVTAGLASYFLYPFGGLRRAYDAATDRKDYFYDDYSHGGVAEEEIIGKVIAGMPENSEYSNSYRAPLARKEAYRNDMGYKQRNSDYFQYPKEYHTLSVGSPVGYRHDVIAEQSKETGYTVGDREYEKKHFVVGNVPKELEQPVTPVTVPEHGPRSLRTRRNAKQLDEENEIDYKDKPQNETPFEDPKTQDAPTEVPTTPEVTTYENTPSTSKPTQPNFFTFIRDVFELKLRVGLGMLLRTTDNFANYLRGVKDRVDNLFRELKSNQ